MKRIFPILLLAMLLGACNSATSEKETTDAVTAKVLLTELSDKASDLEGKEVIMEGMVVHVCKHGGQKLFITDTATDERFLVRVSESIPEFDVALEGSTIEITGTLLAESPKMEQDDHHDGDEHAEGEHMHEGTQGEDDACTEDISYYLKATSFQEK